MRLDFVRKDVWTLSLLYPVAAFLVYLAGLNAIPAFFQRGWPFFVGGPAELGVWILIAVAGRSWFAIIGGYFLGAVACLIIVVVIQAIADHLKWD